MAMRVGDVCKIFIYALRHSFVDSSIIQLYENLFSLIDSPRKHITKGF